MTTDTGTPGTSWVRPTWMGTWVYIFTFLIALAAAGDLADIVIHQRVPMQIGFTPDANASLQASGVALPTRGWTTVLVPLADLSGWTTTVFVVADLSRTVVIITVASLWARCLQHMRAGRAYAPVALRTLRTTVWTTTIGYAFFCVTEMLGENLAVVELGLREFTLHGEAVPTLMKLLIVSAGGLTLHHALTLGSRALDRRAAEAP
ncbi:hypothetical protein [Brevibacterium litoralis]|uniref:hypothetical protein n=1 Tax=Brevibacterium litoralis TaxID=3138935 RepID=UPI0032EC1C6F